MNLYNMMQEFEQEVMAKAEVENPPYLRTTPVATVINTVPSTLYQDSYSREVNAGYSWDTSTVTAIKEFEHTNQGLCYNGKQVANFYLEIEKMALMLSGDSGENYSGYRIQIKTHTFQNGREYTHILKNISKGELESLDLLDKIPFAVANSKVTKADFKGILYSYANYLLANFSGETEYVTRSTGWRTFQGKKIYVDAEKALGFPELPIHSSAGLRIRDSADAKDLWSEFQNMRHVLHGKGQMDALLLYVMNSFLFSLFNEAKKTIKHCMFLVGERGSRKTAVALCFSQLENKESPEFNFLATESGIQSHFQNYHDSCILIDDLAPSINVAKRNSSEQKLEMIVRLFGDAGKRVINTHFVKDAVDNLDYSVKGGALITGEYFYSAGVESSIARAIVLELEKNSVDLKRLTYYQKHPEVLETLIFRFIVFISKHWDESKKLIKDVVECYREKYQMQFSNGRYADYIGQYMAEAYLLEAFFRQECRISNTQGEALCREIEENMLYLLTINDCKMKSRAPINTLLLSILYMVEIGRTISWGSRLPTEEACLIENETALYVRQKDLPDILKAYCAKTGEPYIKMTSQELGKLLKQAEICTVYHEGDDERLAKRYVGEYGTTRLMELSKEAINKKLGVLLNR